MRKNVLIKGAIFTLMVITLLACSDDELDAHHREIVSISGDSVPIESVEELMYFTHYVIRGEVLDSRVEWRDHTVTREHWEQFYLSEGLTDEEIEARLYGIDWDIESEPDLVTIYRIYVLEVFQGTTRTAGDIIEVSRLGGENDEAHWEVEHGTELPLGSELILFLWDRSWSGWGEFSLADTYQAAYYVPSSIEDVEITALDDEDLEIELESVNDWGYNFITLEDLVEIAEENDLLDE